ncbi:hypothetical protein ABTK71_19895, partial [Acinetobacter baumannii]
MAGTLPLRPNCGNRRATCPRADSKVDRTPASGHVAPPQGSPNPHNNRPRPSAMSNVSHNDMANAIRALAMD